MNNITYKQPFEPDSLVFEMTKESGRIYTKAVNLNKIDHKSISEINVLMQEYCKSNTRYLQSQSAQASYQSFLINLKSYFKALKQFKKNPSKFSGKPRAPHKNKFMYKLTFKKSAIRRKNNELWLSTKKPNEPIKVKWAKSLPIPNWVIINYDRFEGWNINFVLEKEYKILDLDTSHVMGIDLGVKRVATTFDTATKETITYSGKELMSLTRLRNKIDGQIKSKRSRFKKNSRKYKNISRSKRKITRRIKNKEKDIIEKFSKTITDDAISKGIGTIVIGDNSSTHKNTNTGKKWNQNINQGVEQKLSKRVQEKFNRVGGTASAVPEPYTSRTCPCCNNIKPNSPKGRIYTCKKCGFIFDRDGVGSINITKENTKNVSFGCQWWLDVVGGLTPPKGVKYSPRLSPFQDSKKILNGCQCQGIANTLSVPAMV